MNEEELASLSLEKIFALLPLISEHHSPCSKSYGFLEQLAAGQTRVLFCKDSRKPKEFMPFGKLVFPYCKMGAVDSLNLFEINTLIMFSFYWINRRKYKRALDIGANIGLHSIILNKCGYEVHCFEPDPKHFAILLKNLSLNNCSGVRPFNLAVSNKNAVMEFIRVVGNTTGSHIAGSKTNPYGILERFPVKTKAFTSLIGWADLVKLDVEGHEKEILLSTECRDWLKTDAFVEIDNENNVRPILRHFKKIKINLFSQKRNWLPVRNIKDMPCNYREGSLFITSGNKMNWAL